MECVVDKKFLHGEEILCIHRTRAFEESCSNSKVESPKQAERGAKIDLSNSNKQQPAITTPTWDFLSRTKKCVHIHQLQKKSRAKKMHTKARALA